MLQVKGPESCTASNLSERYQNPLMRERILGGLEQSSTNNKQSIMVGDVYADLGSFQYSQVILMTDFGDYAHGQVSAAMKAEIAVTGKSLPSFTEEANLPPFDILQGSFAAATLFDIPLSSLGAIIVDPGVNSSPSSPLFRTVVAIKTAVDDIVVLPNNGLATYIIARRGIVSAWEIKNDFYFNRSGFGRRGATCQARDLIGPAAIHVGLSEKNLGLIGTPISVDDIKILPIIPGSSFPDRFGNLKFNLYLPVGVKEVTVETEDKQQIRVLVRDHGGFADYPPGQLACYRGSSLALPEVGGLTEICYPQNFGEEAKATDVLGKNPRIISIRI
jgi:S-adenosylmethionine hydrolase